MAQIKLTVENINGIHARPAAEIVKAAGEYSDCEIFLEVKGTQTDAKSIMGILMLKITHGTEVTVIAKGSGEDDVVVMMEKLFKEKFGFEE